MKTIFLSFHTKMLILSVPLMLFSVAVQDSMRVWETMFAMPFYVTGDDDQQ